MVKRKISMLNQCDAIPQEDEIRVFLATLSSSRVSQLNAITPLETHLSGMISCVPPGFWTCSLAVSKVRGWMGLQSTAQRGARRSEQKQLVERHRQQSRIDTQCMKYAGWVLVKMKTAQHYKHGDFGFDNEKIANWIWLQYVDSSHGWVILKSNTLCTYTTACHPHVNPLTCQFNAHSSIVTRQLDPSTKIGLYYSGLPCIGQWVGRMWDVLTNRRLYHTLFRIDSTALHQLDSWLHLYPPRIKKVCVSTSVKKVCVSTSVKRRRVQPTVQTHTNTYPEWITAFPYELWLLIGMYFVSDAQT